MKLHLSPNAALNTVTAYGTGYVEINAQRYDHAVLFAPDSPVQPWSETSFADLTAHDFDAVLALAPEIVLLGTGSTQRFVHPKLIAALSSKRIGVEAMDTRAACRTYNILMSESRKVVAALLMIQDTTKG